MRLNLISLSVATLLLSVTPAFLPPTLTLSPLVAQPLSNEDSKAKADRLLKEGMELYDNINFGGALERFEEALLIYQGIGDKIGEGTTFHQIGLVYNSRNEYQQASDYYQRALAVQRDVSDGAGARVSLYRIGKIYDRLGDYQPALDYYQQALAIRQELRDGNERSAACRDRAWQGITFKGTGRVYQQLEEYQQAFDNYQQALAIEQELSDCADEDIPPSYARGATLFYNTGLVAQKLGEYQQALDSYQKALAIYQGLDDRDEQGLILSNMGVVYRKLGEYQQGIDAFKRAEEMNFLIRNFGQGGTFNNIGLIYYELGEYQQALDSYQKALAFSQKIHDRAGEGVSLNNMGGAYHKLEKYQQALDSYQQALAIIQEVGDKKGEGVALNNIGAVYDKLEQYQQALDSYQKALPIFQAMGNGAFEAVTLNNIGAVYDKLGDSQQARDYYEQALEIQEEIGDKQGEGIPPLPITLNLEPLILPKSPTADQESEELKLYQIGIQLSKQGQYREALETLQQALVIARELRDQAREWKNLNQIGLVYSNLGEYQLALNFLQKSLAIPKQVFENTGAIHYNIGLVYSRLGDYTKALEFYQQASALTQKLGNKAGEVRILNAMGNVHSHLKQYELALDSYQQALELLKTIDFEKKLLEGATLNNIAQVYRRQGKYELALELFSQALTIQKQFGSKAGEGLILDNMGEAYYHLGQYPTALEYYQQALVISQEIGDRAREGENLSNIGYLLEKQNQSELAIIFFKQSVNAREAIRENIKGLPQEQQQSYTETIAEDYRHLADLLLQQNRILEAQRVLDLLKVQELDDYLRNVRGTENTVQGVPNLSPEQQIEDGYQEILNKAIALGKELTQLRQKSNRTSQEEQRLVELVNAQEKIITNFNNFIESDEVEALISQLTPKTRKPDLINTLDDLLSIQNNLKDLQQNAVLLYPLILEDRLELILTTPDSPPIRRTVPVTKEKLSQTILAFRQALQNPKSDAKTPAQQLYNWLIKPLENDLKAAEAETLIYAPDGQLRYIPLAALHDGEQWLIQRYRINNITAASLTELDTQPQYRRSAGTSLRVLAGAFTTGHHSVTIGKERFNFGGLPYAGVEVETLAATVPNTTQLFNNAFNPEDTKPKMGDYNVLHFATHGAIVVGTPEESFILFGDGTPVTIADVRNWNLNNVDLVVLSACETGIGGNLGTGAEILGLGYQMQRAGARAAIASLWTVDDGGTQLLMNEFYSALQNGNTTKAEALRQAQVALITGDYTASREQRGSIVAVQVRDGLKPEVVNRLNHPYYWAPFILIGNGL
ncbi:MULTISPECIES: CHAT domain-containing protein [unclassified Coleofasciculus]|uniref:CHAT domain-containing protein n=1 Tax=unclassified Coleofasciculus TaxID=2692782 RepID=UPI00187F0A00|nr:MULTISPECIES: tetratricopeptide repeat protein [unclassified Coleofasciculus]MBE9127957.1 tetratricopeptide repeat protein [Coleofasciculus sp. LEGE 07081]MBE9149864.1 tetratricopeptide repeat protein [Coleofasciculus sp. LEGE 07092]